MGLRLRAATPEDAPLLRRWDETPHVLASDPNDDWDWEHELARSPPWREQLLAELSGTPVGFVQVIDPREEESHYWGPDVAPDLRAVDLWIGEAACLGRGCGTEIMRLALARCFGPPAIAAVLIDPLASNSGARRFYERLGFVAVGPRRFGLDECVVYRLERAEWLRRERAAREQAIDEEVRIRATPARVWAALTEPQLTERYWGGTRVESDWRPGSAVRYLRGGEVTDEHLVLGVDPPWTLEQTFRPRFGEFRDEAPSRVRISLEADGEHVRVHVRHDGFPPASRVHAACREGWPAILAGLARVLESERHGAPA